MTAVRFLILPTDALIFAIVFLAVGFYIYSSRKEHLRAPWRQILMNPVAMIALFVLIPFVLVGLLDSIHYRRPLAQTSTQGAVIYSPEIQSVLDTILEPLHTQVEDSYSEPFAAFRFDKITVEYPDGTQARVHPRLKFGGRHLKNPATQKQSDILKRVFSAFATSFVLWVVVVSICTYLLSIRYRQPWRTLLGQILKGRPPIPWRSIFTTLFVVLVCIVLTTKLCPWYHILGTDKVGQDVFYQSLKSIRTGLVVGTITTLIMLPFAVFLGTAAGYFGGRVDDVIQYVYTTLNSIPGVLLIAAAILMINVYIDNHSDLISSIEQRSDLRLLALCTILGIMSWTGLCRLLRGETMKIRDLDFIQAARAMGAGHFRIIGRHILPNVMHIILITVILDFSGLVLAEAVLSYIGIGVDPTMNSWGNMINGARMEMAREPVVWWPLFSAFSLMLLLVLSVNLFGDAVRDAFDPRIRKHS